jgi:hypothetical protein
VRQRKTGHPAKFDLRSRPAVQWMPI